MTSLRVAAQASSSWPTRRPIMLFLLAYPVLNLLPPSWDTRHGTTGHVLRKSHPAPRAMTVC